MQSLFESVVSSLNKLSPDAATKFAQHYNPAMLVQEQIPHLNRYLRIQLGLLPVNTIAERECLMDDVSQKEWLRLFNKHVAPTIVAYGLPDWK